MQIDNQTVTKPLMQPHAAFPLQNVADATKHYMLVDGTWVECSMDMVKPNAQVMTVHIGKAMQVVKDAPSITYQVPIAPLLIFLGIGLCAIGFLYVTCGKAAKSCKGSANKTTLCIRNYCKRSGPCA